MKRIGLHIFRRDLRLFDNTALNALSQKVDEIVPVFIFTPQQIKNNSYKSNNAAEFLWNSLQALKKSIESQGGKFLILYGENKSVWEKLCKSFNPKCVAWNYDYTPFSIERDKSMINFFEQKGIGILNAHDALLTPPGSVTKDDGKPYTIFTPFRKKAEKILVPNPETKKIIWHNFEEKLFKTVEQKTIFPISNPHLRVKGGRTEALELLVDFLTRVKKYDSQRDMPSVVGTSYLSAHLKFGTVSVREVFHEIFSLTRGDSVFLHELYWRDFFSHIAAFFPSVFGSAFKTKYNDISWPNRTDWFAAWKTGQTGFPIVDAGMRELNKTGYMHNRVRMIVASFLVKDLHIDWRWGEQYFAQKLVDYDPAINNGNWQWAASTGCDAQPYFRIFNPWRQAQRFDPEAKYIKRWVPELAYLSAKEIFSLETQSSAAVIFGKYPEKIVDHKAQAEKSKTMFKNNL